MVNPRLQQAAPQDDFRYRHVLLVLDNSAHSNRGIEVGLEIARCFGARVTASHAYAARLHDLRFKQMEGGLPEKYRKEDELERQRKVHDTLIGKGLALISDSYLDVAEEKAVALGLDLRRSVVEGKNYRAILDDIEAHDYDLVVLGALGLGAVKGSLIGTVCERVVRRTDRDVLVIKDPERGLDGPILVAVDGSARGYAGLKSALCLAREVGVPVEVVSAFDPFFHYVAFNSIAGVLSEEAGSVFKFKEQEALHEDIIDSGLAKIYQGHLAIAATLAEEDGMQVETKLLAGKPFEVILEHAQKRAPSLLVVGRTGIHADEGLDLGGNTENLLRSASCHVLICGREFTPRVEQIAEETTTWTQEAQAQMERVPVFARNMARTAILRYAQEQGHTVISSKIVEDAVSRLLPPSAMEAMGLIAQAAEKRAKQKAQAARATREGGERTFDDRVVHWGEEALAALEAAGPAVRHNVKLRTEKLARGAGTNRIEPSMVREAMGEAPADNGPGWESDAIAHLESVPEGFMRDRTKERIEAYARAQGAALVTREVCEAGLAEARKAMVSMAPGADTAHAPPTTSPLTTLRWTEEAEARLRRVPEGFMREMTHRRVEAYARKHGASEITLELVEQKYADWKKGSQNQKMTMPWEHEALERIMRIPDFVRAMVVLEVERCAKESGRSAVSPETLTRAMHSWQKGSGFHSEGKPEQYRATGKCPIDHGKK